MREATLCFLLRGDEVCLAMKKVRFGAGKWNGAGGRVEDGERVTEAAARETREELGVSVREEDLAHAATVACSFPEHPEWDTRVEVFLARSWRGEPGESDELSPRWFRTDALPYAEMWSGDVRWLPAVLAGKCVDVALRFAGAGEEVEECVIAEKP